MFELESIFLYVEYANGCKRSQKSIYLLIYAIDTAYLFEDNDLAPIGDPSNEHINICS